MKKSVLAASASAFLGVFLGGCGGAGSPVLSMPAPISWNGLASGNNAGLDEPALAALTQQSGTDFGSQAACITYMDSQLWGLLVDSNGDLYSGVENLRAEDNAGSSNRSFSYGTRTYGNPVPPRPGETRPPIVLKAGYMFTCNGGVFQYIPPPPPPSAPPQR